MIAGSARPFCVLRFSPRFRCFLSSVFCSVSVLHTLYLRFSGFPVLSLFLLCFRPSLFFSPLRLSFAVLHLPSARFHALSPSHFSASPRSAAAPPLAQFGGRRCPLSHCHRSMFAFLFPCPFILLFGYSTHTTLSIFSLSVSFSRAAPAPPCALAPTAAVPSPFCFLFPPTVVCFALTRSIVIQCILQLYKDLSFEFWLS